MVEPATTISAIVLVISAIIVLRKILGFFAPLIKFGVKMVGYAVIATLASGYVGLELFL